jgi:hypothetical protein
MFAGMCRLPSVRAKSSGDGSCTPVLAFGTVQ